MAVTVGGGMVGRDAEPILAAAGLFLGESKMKDIIQILLCWTFLGVFIFAGIACICGILDGFSNLLE